MNQYMQKERTYPGLYIGEDIDTRALIPNLYTQGYHVLLLRNRTPENETLLGRRYYDYSDAALTGCAPGLFQAGFYMKTSLQCRWIVAFRPELFEDTVSENELSEYTFFAYYPKEALHLSVAETQVITACINDLCTELQRPRDPYTGTILSRHLHRILDYTVRFYERQFITRELVVEKIIARYDSLLGEYIASGKLRTYGMPTARYCADKLLLSEACFCDILKHKTGHTHACYTEIKRIETAKRQLCGSNLSLHQIVTDLGFPSVQYFSYLFKKLTGCSPNCYRFIN